MSAERASETPADRARVLQEHLCDRAASLVLPSEPRSLHREIQAHLLRACDEKLLAMKPQDIYARLKLSTSSALQKFGQGWPNFWPRYAGGCAGAKLACFVGAAPQTPRPLRGRP